jgi:hypothetical protein
MKKLLVKVFKFWRILMSYKSKKSKPFYQLPKHKRKDAVFYLKKDIKKYETIFGGEFSSYLMPNDEPDFKAQWFPVFFFGIDSYTFWNAKIETAKNAFANEVDKLASQKIESMLTDEEYKASFSIRLEPSENKKSFHAIEQEPRKHEKFGGLTYQEKFEQLKSEIVENEPPKIYEIFQHDYSYRSGIGLHIIVNVDAINRAVIKKTIATFRSLGEINWKSSQEVPLQDLTPIRSNQFEDDYPLIYFPFG